MFLEGIILFFLHLPGARQWQGSGSQWQERTYSGSGGGGGDRGLAGRQRPREAGGGRRAVSGGSGKEAAGSGRQFQVNKVKWHPPAKEGLGGHSSPGEPR